MNIKLAAPVCGRILAALVTASVLMASCGGGGGSGQSGPPPISNTSAGSASGTPTPLPTPPTSANTLAIVVDAGPVSGAMEINIAYVTVTVCAPGSTSSCQTIDHVQLDTGSSGLRLLKSELYSSLNLPQVSGASGAIGECAAFVIGTTWGSVRYADIYLGGEVAKNVPFQDIGDTPGGYSAVPTDCSGTGTIQNTQSSMGSNGILGVGLFQNDCESCQFQVIPATYYTCNAGGCTNSMVTATQVVQNPVADFAQDNNGTQISLSPLNSTGSSTSPVTGLLTFGITSSALNGATVYPTDTNGNFITTYNGTSMNGSYIDSGSNGLFFNDPNINPCPPNDWWYCPTPSPLALSATNAAATRYPSGTVSFSIINADNLTSTDVAANIGGPYCNCTQPEFDWGLPFFFGRSVFTAIFGASTPKGPGPYFAY